MKPADDQEEVLFREALQRPKGPSLACPVLGGDRGSGEKHGRETAVPLSYRTTVHPPQPERRQTVPQSSPFIKSPSDLPCRPLLWSPQNKLYFPSLFSCTPSYNTLRFTY